MIEIQVSKADAILRSTETLTSGRVGLPVRFLFSEEWSGLGKEAVFVCGQTKIGVPLDNSNETVVPWEVMQTPRQQLVIGVYGTDGEEVVIPTIYCGIETILPGTVISDVENTREPTASDVDQMLADAAEAAASAAVALSNVIREAEATVDSTTGTPSVEVALEDISADPTDGKKLTLAFSGLKGQGGGGGGGGSSDWNDITNTPTTIGGYGITDAYTKAETGALLGGKANAEHSHEVADITDFPTIPTVPTKTSDLTNDGDGTNAFLTQHQSLSGYATESYVQSYHDSTKSDTSHTHDDRYYTENEADNLLGNKLDSARIAHETWTFTLDDDSTVTKEVALWISAT